jgi:hypothetical protein
MAMKKSVMIYKKENISAWAVGGGLLTGMGVGFFFLETSALVFVGCILIGLGAGLLTAAVISKIGNNGKR